MSGLQEISQSQFLRGLNAVSGMLSQPKGSVPRISNLMYSTRGSLQTVDGTDEIAYPYSGSPFTAVLGLGFVPLSEIDYPNSTAAVIEINIRQGAPTSVSASGATSTGGLIAPNNYEIAFAAWDGNGGIGTLSAPVTVTVSGSQNSISISWDNSNEAVGIAVYYYNGSNFLLQAIFSGTSGTLLSINALGQPSSGVDNTEQAGIEFTGPNYDITEWILPSSPVRSNGTLYVNTFGTYLQSLDPNMPFSIPNGASGGFVGAIGPLPQVVNFGGVPIISLGNTFPPQRMVVNSSSVVTAIQPLANTYSVAYPSWAANTQWAEGSVLQPATPNGHWYTVIQGGVSGASAPIFPTNGGEVSDGTMILQDGGSSAVIAPRGSAHAINHASCLFLWNTYPFATPDGLDGPSVLAQSDVNNPNSWNPVNRTTIGKGDGQNGMGASTFSIAEAGIAPQLTLILFKEFSTYVMTGILPNATITTVQTDMGCIAPRSIQFVEGIGVIRLTHKGFSVTDGIGDKIISDEIRPYLLKNSEGIIPNDQLTGCLAQSFQTFDPPMYCCSLSTAQNNLNATSAQLQFNRLACFDTKLRCWTIVDLPFNIFAMGSIERTAIYSDLYAVFGSLTDGTIHRWMNNDSKWDLNSGTPIAWSVQMPPVYKDGTTRFFADNVLIAGSTLDASVSISVQIFAQGVMEGSPASETPIVAKEFVFSTPGQFQLSVKIKKTISNCWISLSGKGRVMIDAVNWSVRPKASGVPASMMAS